MLNERGLIPRRRDWFYFLHHVCTGSGILTASSPVYIGLSSSEIRRSRREAVYSPSLALRLRTSGTFTSTSRFASSGPLTWSLHLILGLITFLLPQDLCSNIHSPIAIKHADNSLHFSKLAVVPFSRPLTRKLEVIPCYTHALLTLVRTFPFCLNCTLHHCMSDSFP